MKNQEVIKNFIEYKTSLSENKTPNLFFEGNILYSYGYHFPLSVRLNDGFVIALNGYSSTTARHKGLLSLELGNLPFKVLEKRIKEFDNILLLDIKQINQIKDEGLNTIEEVKNHFVLKEL